MRLVGCILVGLLAFAVLNAAIKAAAIVIVLLVVVALSLNPRRTLGTVISLIYIGLLGRYPALMIVVSMALLINGAIGQRRPDG